MLIADQHGTMLQPTPSATWQFMEYVAIAFALAWVLLGLAALTGQGVITPLLPPTALITMATLGPLLAAVGMVAREAGWDSVRDLLVLMCALPVALRMWAQPQPEPGVEQ